MPTPGRNPSRFRHAARRSAFGFLIGAALFAAMGGYMNREIGAPLLSNPGPVGILALIGGTVGGLIAPLLGRRKARHGLRD